MAQRMTVRMAELSAARVPFVHATVVRAEQPTSARPGDDAIILADGTMEGFVGGQCAEESVRAAALGALERGESLLLRVLPGGEGTFPDAPGAFVTVNPCLSGGALEIFLEPLLPAAVISIVGTSPIANAVAELAEPLGFAVSRTAPDASQHGAIATVVCSLGHDEELAIRGALDAKVGLIAVVASHRRGTALLEAMGLTEAECARVRTPAGIEIGAHTPAEIALSILAQVVHAIRVDGLKAHSEGVPTPPQQAIDPVCGMTVIVRPDTPHLRLDDVDHWFCNPGCRDRYAEQAAV
jgi:xanthine dehydrogenase accessory factor